MKACGINPIDTYIRDAGMGQELPYVTGVEGSFPNRHHNRSFQLLRVRSSAQGFFVFSKILLPRIIRIYKNR